MQLQQLLDEGIIEEVFQQLQTGKEAEVWLVSHRGEAVAAKLYKERAYRSFKNDSGYTEGRQVRNSRTQRAMDRGTSFGKRASEEAWKSAEADALRALNAAGVRVPRLVLFYEGVLLMEAIGDAEGRVAPRLIEAGLTKEQALPLYEQLRGEVIKMLAADLIHGDLSEFNILMAADGPVIIDFPQVVAAARNSSSEQFFRRDLGNLLRFFSALNPEVAKHAGDADEIWRAYTRRELSPGYVPSGRQVPKHPQSHQRDGRGGDRHQRRRDGRAPQDISMQGQRPPQQQGQRPPQQQGQRPQQQQGQRPPQQQGQRPPQQQGQRPQQQQGQRPPQQQGQRPAQQQAPQRDTSRQSRGPQVSFKGQVPSTPAQQADAPSASRGGRRRPPRRW